MLSRKQQWRRVKSRRRETRSVQPSNPSQGKSSASGDKDENANSDDEVTTPRTGSPSISPYSSFESVQSALGEPEERSTTAKSVPTSYPRGKGVTFEPEVKVYLVFRDELDDRTKQALWWTGRDAAINKRAWLSHLGQPGCGRQSAGRNLHLLGRAVGIAGAVKGAGHGQQRSVGILGCHCDACLTEGDDMEFSSSHHHFMYDRYNAHVFRDPGYRDWSGTHWPMEQGWGEKGAHSYSPASQSSSPLHDADADVFPNSYFWDRD